MAQPAAKPKRIKTKEEIAKAKKGNIPEFEFYTSDGTAVVLEMLNRGGRVLVTGDTHEAFVELCHQREQKLAAAGADKFEIVRLTALLEAVDDVPADEGEEGADARLYETAADKRARIFNDDQDGVLKEIGKLVSCAALGVRDHVRLTSARIERDYYYEALRMIVATDDDALAGIVMADGEPIPDEYRDEIAEPWDSDAWRGQNYEDVRQFVDSFRSRVGL